MEIRFELGSKPMYVKMSEKVPRILRVAYISLAKASIITKMKEEWNLLVIHQMATQQTKKFTTQNEKFSMKTRIFSRKMKAI